MRGIGDADHATRRQLATQRAQARPLPRQARAQPAVGVVQPAAETAADALERIQSRKVGRASCRESVGKYVSIPVVAVSLTKQNQNPVCMESAPTYVVMEKVCGA